MENNEDKGKTPSEPKITATPPPPKRPAGGGSSTKWIAVIIALLVVVGVLGALVAMNYHPAAASGGPTGTLSAKAGAISQGEYYNTTMNATGSFKSMTVYFGDGTSHVYNYSGSNSVSVSHQYKLPGEFYVFADINYGSSNGYYLEPVKVTPQFPPDYAYQSTTVDPTQSTTQLINNLSNIFQSNAHMTLGFNPVVGGGVNQVVSQTFTLMNQSGVVSSETIPWAYSTSGQAYEQPISSLTYANMQNGMYVLQINTTTAPVNTTQTITSVQTSGSYTSLYDLYLTGTTPVNHAFTNDSTLMGSGSNNVSYAMPISNLTFGMGNAVTFQSAGTLMTTSAANLTVLSGSATYSNATVSAINVNMTGSAQNYSNVPASYTVSITAGTTVMFNSGATVFNAVANALNFTGAFSVEFLNPTTVGMTNMQSGNVGTGVTYNAGTAFTNLNGATATLAGRKNVTVANGTETSFSSAVNVFMNTGSNVTLKAGTIKDLKTGNVLTSTSERYDLNASGNYQFSASSDIIFNPATTGFMLNQSSSAMTFAGNSNQLTLVNKTSVTFSSPGTYLKEWTPLSLNRIVTGTATVPLNNGQYDASATATSTYYEDFPVMHSVKQNTGAQTSFTNAEPNAPGGYTTLDPAIEYYTADVEILQNTLLTLDTYNGSSTSSFVPIIATSLPTLGNGINAHYHNYTQTTPWGQKYVVNETPGQNYTFHVNTNIQFQDGEHMSAWDVLYSLTRTLLFDAASPPTGGWVMAQYLLPGDYFSSNSFYNITHNITVDNSSNTITFHFQTSMPASLVFQVLQSSGSQVEPAAWFKAHNAGITWNATGFQQYKAQGDLANYNTYIQNHIMADGPYMLSYVIPGAQVTLVKNPNYVVPNPYFRKATINTVNILYLSSNEQAYLLLRSGQAQNAALPTTYWNQTTQMVNSGQLQRHGFPTLGVYFYTYTENIDTKMLKQAVDSKANLPSGLFVNPNMRKVFSYAYNYSLYYAKQVGNQIYNTTFLAPYVGMLPPGMLYNQTSADLQALHTNVINANGHEPFQMSQAQKYLGYFLNGKNSPNDGAKSMGIHQASDGKLMYGTSQLTVPLMIPNSDPVDKAAATTWGQDLAKLGIATTVDTLPLTDIFGAYAIPGANPMPVSWGGWSPDYPYPTDYLLPMGMPLAGSTYMGPAGYTPNVVGNSTYAVYNMTEAAFMHQELGALNNATNNATNPAMAKHWFHVTNGMIVNSTTELYIGQQTLHWTLDSAINGNDIINYQENVMIGGGQELQYFLLNYNSTSSS